MSTRAAYTFQDDQTTVHVYKHHDGYPTGAADAINNALCYAWPLPRFEADDFAAAFVAGNKVPSWLQESVKPLMQGLAKRKRSNGFDDVTEAVNVTIPYYAFGKNPVGQGGGVRLIPGTIEDFTSDIAYRYVITQNSIDRDLYVEAFAADFWEETKKSTLLFRCKLKDFARRAKVWEKQQSRKG